MFGGSNRARQVRKAVIRPTGTGDQLFKAGPQATQRLPALVHVRGTKKRSTPIETSPGSSCLSDNECTGSLVFEVVVGVRSLWVMSTTGQQVKKKERRKYNNLGVCGWREEGGCWVLMTKTTL